MNAMLVGTAFVSLFALGAFNVSEWPGLPPDCWPQSRFVHTDQSDAHWKQNVAIQAKTGERPKEGTVSPNKGYVFIVSGSRRPEASIIIFAEKDRLIEIAFSNLYGITDVKWVNEKLLFFRPWWGRIGATDLIFDVEAEEIIYAENLVDGHLAYEQFKEGCRSLGGCRCIEKQ